MKVKLYALSTCAWCKKTKRFLEDNHVEHEHVYVDLLTGDEKTRILSEMSALTPRRIFPTVVVNDKEVIVGYHEERLREILGL